MKNAEIVDAIFTVGFMLFLFAVGYFVFIITPDPFYG